MRKTFATALALTMQTIGKASRWLPVPAFVAAALAFGAMPPAHATDQESPCTKSLSTALSTAGISQLAATNVAVAAEANGDFAVTWDIPDGSPVPPGAVLGFCLNKEHEDGDDWFGCWYKEGLGPDFTPTASSLESRTVDSCYGPSGIGVPPCYDGAHKFQVKVEPACPNISNPYSDFVSAESTLGTSSAQ